MTKSQLYGARWIVALILIACAIGAYVYQARYKTPYIPVVQRPEEVVLVEESVPAFAWRYAAARTLNLDGQPNTDVYLDTTYPDGQTASLLVDTVGSNCNDMSETEPDSAPTATVSQCYGAGIGYRYKVVRGAISYMVQRKTFDEAVPGASAVTYTYQTIKEIPFR